MKILNYKKGRQGEDVAKQFLIDKGFGFIEANFTLDKGMKGEIDLIMSDQGWLVFVEVKYKSDNHFGIPEEMVNKRKLAQVRRVAEIYLLKNPEMRKKFIKYRIDAICIQGREIRHYSNLYA